MYVMHLNSTCNQNKSKESIFVEQRDEKEVPTKSYGRGNGIFPPPPPPPPPPPLWFLAQTEEWGKKCKLGVFILAIVFLSFGLRETKTKM